ncbi:MAG: 16S rRNA (adenine(1518)-N(6)/adenine(1519)-N(6))-dimethyltransferase RsmA [Planctomycetota bacterium]|jgi:16S rRNA (adenine1518-N6/adenine1519-N6)-dimethyltransferase
MQENAEDRELDILPTKTELRELLSARGIRPRRAMGQNFLIDHNMLRFIVRQAELSKSDLVLEIGPGPGHFTGLLAAAAGHVIAVEIDSKLADICREYLAGTTNAEVINADILARKSEINPEVMALCRKLHGGALAGLKMVSNLPYSAATPAVLNLLESDLRFDFLLVLVQDEIAEKFTAEPNSADYGTVSVLTQAAADIEYVRSVPRQLFWPEPEVESALVRITPRREPLLSEPRFPAFRGFVKLLFSQRRKTLLKTISHSSQRNSSPVSGRKEIEGALENLGAAKNARAQELTVEELAKLFLEITERS